MSDDLDELSQQIRDAILAGQEQQAFDAMALSPHPDAEASYRLCSQRLLARNLQRAAGAARAALPAVAWSSMIVLAGGFDIVGQVGGDHVLAAAAAGRRDDR